VDEENGNGEEFSQGGRGKQRGGRGGKRNFGNDQQENEKKDEGDFNLLQDDDKEEKKEEKKEEEKKDSKNQIIVNPASMNFQKESPQCQHVSRKNIIGDFVLYFNCCHMTYKCRKCHKEKSQNKHEIDTHPSSIYCKKCNIHNGPKSETCTGCNATMFAIHHSNKKK